MAVRILATLLAMVGIYGVTSFAVARRTREIGIRIAFGAPTSTILFGVVGDVLKLTLFGVGVGVVSSYAIAKPLQSQLYAMDRIEPGIVGAAIVTIIAVSIFAGIFPAVRAMRVDPATALRQE